MGKNFKYNNVVSYIEKYIEENSLKAGDRLPTESEIIKMLSVSRITAQKAYSEMEHRGIIVRNRGKGTFVAESNINRSKANVIDFIGVIFPAEYQWGINYKILSGIQEIAEKHKCYITIHNSAMDVKNEEGIINQLIQDGARGIILLCVDTTKNIKLFRHLVYDKYPIVFIDRHPLNINVNYVGSDNYSGAYQLVTHLIELGHKHIAFISNEDKSINTINERYNGYIDAMRDNNISINPEFIKIRDGKPDYNYQQVTKMIDELLNLEIQPTAVFAINDMIAYQCINYITTKGIDVPVDISITGFDKSYNNDHMPFSLTTVEQHLDEIGKTAGELVFAISENKNQYIKREILPVNFCKGQSTKPCCKKF